MTDTKTSGKKLAQALRDGAQALRDAKSAGCTGKAEKLDRLADYLADTGYTGIDAKSAKVTTIAEALREDESFAAEIGHIVRKELEAAKRSGLFAPAKTLARESIDEQRFTFSVKDGWQPATAGGWTDSQLDKPIGSGVERSTLRADIEARERWAAQHAANENDAREHALRQLDECAELKAEAQRQMKVEAWKKFYRDWGFSND